MQNEREHGPEAAPSDAAGPPDGSRPLPRLTSPTVVVVMGVSGSGKTTVAALLAATLNWRFQDGDDLHPPENVAKMHSGTPLNDDDRRPWLAAIAAVVDDWLARGICGVLTCSALKRAYRDIIIGNRRRVRLVYLEGSRELIARRLAARHEHFMPAALLDSQFQTLEVPTPDERPIVVPVKESLPDIVTMTLRALAARDRED